MGAWWDTNGFRGDTWISGRDHVGHRALRRRREARPLVELFDRELAHALAQDALTYATEQGHAVVRDSAAKLLASLAQAKHSDATSKGCLDNRDCRHARRRRPRLVISTSRARSSGRSIRRARARGHRAVGNCSPPAPEWSAPHPPASARRYIEYRLDRNSEFDKFYIMPKPSEARASLPPAAARALRQLGENLAIARVRRRESQRVWAKRLGVSIPTLIRMERGDPGIGIGIVATALWMIGRAQELPELADPKGDRGALELDVRQAIRRRAVRSAASVEARLGRKRAPKRRAP
jgi:transcriptional regulator with XRE-family HTH domain